MIKMMLIYIAAINTIGYIFALILYINAKWSSR